MTEIKPGKYECMNMSGYGLTIPDDMNTNIYSGLVEIIRSTSNMIYNCSTVNANVCPEDCPVKLLKEAAEKQIFPPKVY